MPNLLHALSTLGMDRFKVLFEWYSKFENDLSKLETYLMDVFFPTLKWCRLYVKLIKMHIYASEKMLYWFDAYGNYNYACQFSYYWSSQQALAQDHPSIFQHFKDNGFSIRRTAGRLWFNKVSPDQVIEQSINKDKKGRGNLKQSK